MHYFKKKFRKQFWYNIAEFENFKREKSFDYYVLVSTFYRQVSNTILEYIKKAKKKIEKKPHRKREPIFSTQSQLFVLKLLHRLNAI